MLAVNSEILINYLKMVIFFLIRSDYFFIYDIGWPSDEKNKLKYYIIEIQYNE